MKRLALIIGMIFTLSACNTGGDDNIARYLLGGALCSLGGDSAGACMSSFADGMDRNNKPKKTVSNKSTTTSSSSSSKSCSSDYSCGHGQLCVKKAYSQTGVCMTSVDEYGMKNYPDKSTNSIYMGTTNKSCQYITDCPVSFTCDRTYNVCVKN